MVDTTKPARWFRMYAEFANDPKVQMLSEVNQRRYLMLLCLRCSNGDVTLQDEQIAFQLRILNSEWIETKTILNSLNLIQMDNLPTAWDRRQMASDSSAARVARHREKKKLACNVTVTEVSRQVEGEIEKEIKNKNTCSNHPKAAPLNSRMNKPFDDFYAEYPKKQAKADALKAFNSLAPSPELLAQILASVRAWRESQEWRKDGGKFIPLPATWLRGRRWEDERMQSPVGVKFGQARIDGEFVC